ncbi:YoxJ protein [Bacillus sp. JCM 19046]|nr:YoxJ protein [Bacillus sp. JCM 19046]
MTGWDWFMSLIIVWTFILLGLMLIGGFFMFRKFLKRLPKEDGKSILDWQAYYIEQALPLWKDEQRSLLNELVQPVPELFRDVAKEKIAGKISEIALKENATQLTLDMIIRGYIIATPKKDHRFLIKN